MLAFAPLHPQASGLRLDSVSKFHLTVIIFIFLITTINLWWEKLQHGCRDTLSYSAYWLASGKSAPYFGLCCSRSLVNTRAPPGRIHVSLAQGHAQFTLVTRSIHTFMRSIHTQARVLVLVSLRVGLTWAPSTWVHRPTLLFTHAVH